SMRVGSAGVSPVAGTRDRVGEAGFPGPFLSGPPLSAVPMNRPDLLRLPIRQIAYFVPDVRTAATKHHALHGSGPYFIADHIPLRRALHRGTERPLDHTSAYGQWGDVMIEFVQQNNAGPSAFHDVYPEGSGRQGIHHVAVFVDSVSESVASYA